MRRRVRAPRRPRKSPRSAVGPSRRLSCRARSASVLSIGCGPIETTFVPRGWRTHTQPLPTELLVLAQRRGLRIHEVPVDWIDDPDSRVDLVRTALDDLRGVARLMAAGPVFRFMTVGVASTLAYAGLFLALRERSAQPARTRSRWPSPRSGTRPPTRAPPPP